MKSLWATVLLSLTVVFCACVNGVYLHRTTESLTRTVAALPDAAAEVRAQDLSQLRAQWQKCRFLVSLTVPAAHTDGIELALSAMESAAAVRDEALYRQGRAALLLWIGKLHEAEACSWEGIL